MPSVEPMTMPSVLVVDDDPAIRETLGELLRAEGYDVSSAENGAVALRIMRTNPRPDVIVLDLMMPIMSGWELLEEVEADASLSVLPILVVSAMGAPVASQTLSGGVRMCLPKPPDVDALLDALRNLIVIAATNRASSEGWGADGVR